MSVEIKIKQVLWWKDVFVAAALISKAIWIIKKKIKYTRKPFSPYSRCRDDIYT